MTYQTASSPIGLLIFNLAKILGKEVGLWVQFPIKSCWKNFIWTHNYGCKS